jgi:hypothetical protein
MKRISVLVGLCLCTIFCSMTAFPQGVSISQQVTQAGTVTTGQGIVTNIVPNAPNSCIQNAACNPSQFNGIIFVDGVTYKQSPDIGIGINAAYAALPANGGTIVVPAGSFNFATPIVFGTANKPAILQCAGSWATQLTYTGTLSATAITENYGPGAVTNHPRGNGIRDCTIVGPGASSTGIGLLLGGTNGAEGFRADGINIGGFNQVLVCANNFWGSEVHNSIIRNGVTNLFSCPASATNTGESLSFTATTFIQDQIGAFAGCILLANSNTDTMLSNVSVDNCQIAISLGSLYFNNIDAYWLVAQTAPFISVTGSVNVSGDALHFINTQAGTTAPSVVSMTAGVMNINGIAVNSTGYTFPNLFALSNGAQLSVFGTQSGGYTSSFSLTTFTGSIALHNLTFPNDNFLFAAGASDATVQIQNLTASTGQSWVIDSLAGGNLSIFPKTDATKLLQLPGNFFAASGSTLSKQFIANQGSACTNGELALSGGWQLTGSATVTAVAGIGQTCNWTITTGTTTGAAPTVTDTLTNPLPAATTVCEMNIHGGTHTAAAGEGFTQTALSITAPIFTFIGTPTAGGTTYFVTRRCGP